MRSVKLMLLQLSAIVGLTQLIIGVLLSYFIPQANLVIEIIADAIILTMITTPIVYWKIILPHIRMNDKLNSQMQSFDQMTNLGNRRNLYDQLKHLIAYNSRHRLFGAVLLIDLDKLSEIHEQLGQDPVKKIFMITAKRLIATIRKEDIVCHTGGSEFYILLTRLTEDKSQSHDHARLAAKRILTVLQEPLLFKKKPLDIRPYIGIQLISPEITSVRRILNDLDTAMYNAKRSEEDPIAFAEETLAQFGLTHQK